MVMINHISLHTDYIVAIMIMYLPTYFKIIFTLFPIPTAYIYENKHNEFMSQ